MRNVFAVLLMGFWGVHVGAAEIVEKAALVCESPQGKTVGLALTHWRTADQDQWDADVFTEADLEKYASLKSFAEIDPKNFTVLYNNYEETIYAYDRERRESVFYRCEKLGLFDRIGRNKDWYYFLRAYLY